jgi:glutaminase
VIRREYDGGQVRSKRARTLRELEILFRAGRRIRVLEAQDALFFGSTERLIRRAARLAADADYLILDVRHVISADIAACRLLISFVEMARATGDRVIFAHLGEPLHLLAEHLQQALGDTGATIFASRDLALEYCEDRLIAEKLPATEPGIGFEEYEIFRGLDAPAIALLGSVAQAVSFAAGDVIARAGDEATRFFVLARGKASVVSTASGATGLRPIRLGSLGPGMCFGERGLIDGGLRSADVVADSAVEAYAFAVDQIRALGHDHPAILITRLGNMAADLAERLQVANAEIRAFGD